MALKLQAETWCMEARAHKSSLHEAYQHITGAKGEPGNWNGARPIIEAFTALKEALEIEKATAAAEHIAHRDRVAVLEAEVERLKAALDTFAIMANDDTAYLPDEHVIVLSYDDTALDADLGGPNTLLGERFMRAFRAARQALEQS